MTMADWIVKLDNFLKMSDREILDHAGKIFHEQASEKAAAEYDIYSEQQAKLSHSVDQHFDDSLDELKRIEKQRKKNDKGNHE